MSCAYRIFTYVEIDITSCFTKFILKLFASFIQRKTTVQKRAYKKIRRRECGPIGPIISGAAQDKLVGIIVATCSASTTKTWKHSCVGNWTWGVCTSYISSTIYNRGKKMAQALHASLHVGSLSRPKNGKYSSLEEERKNEKGGRRRGVGKNGEREGERIPAWSNHLTTAEIGIWTIKLKQRTVQVHMAFYAIHGSHTFRNWVCVSFKMEVSFLCTIVSMSRCLTTSVLR